MTRQKSILPEKRKVDDKPVVYIFPESPDRFTALSQDEFEPATESSNAMELYRSLRDRMRVGQELKSIREVMLSPEFIVKNALGGRGPFNEGDFLGGGWGAYGTDKWVKKWDVGSQVAKEASREEGNLFFLSDTDFTLVPFADAAKLMAEKNNPEAKVGAFILDAHADVFPAGSLGKSAALGFELGFFGKIGEACEDLDDVPMIHVEPALSFATIIGLPGEMSHDRKIGDRVETVTSISNAPELIFENDILAFSERQYFTGGNPDPMKLGECAEKAVNAMTVAGVTNMIFNVDVDVLRRTGYYGFEYSLDKPSYKGGDYRGLDGMQAISVLKQACRLAHEKGIEVGVPTRSGRMVTNITEYIPEYDAGETGDFIKRMIKVVNGEVSMLYGRSKQSV